jgi:hypothetical protein
MGRECAKYVAAWRGLSPEQRVVQKIKKEEKRLQKIQDREARHQRALIRAKEDNRRRALAAYHAGAKLRQVSGGFYWESKKARRRSLFAAARRVFLPRRESPQKLAAAARSVARRWKRRGNAHLNKILRGRLENIVKKTKIHCMSVSKMARDLVGCELWELRAHLERQFKPGMTWENHSFTGWHVDHKRPLAKFDLSIPEQAAQAFHFSNLQPLWAAENLSKGTKMI